MAAKLLVILLLLACSAIFGPVSSASVGGDSQIYEETDIDDPEVGRVHDVREVDSRCRHEKNTNTLPDGSKNTVLDDYQDGKSVILVSNYSDACLVRDIDPEERAQANTCKDGMVTRDKSKPDKEEKDYVKSETEMTDKEKEELPEALKAACEGKSIYKLITQQGGDDSGNDVAGREKRGLRLCYRCYYRYTCYTRCRWYGCVRYCSRRIYCRLTWCYYG